MCTWELIIQKNKKLIQLTKKKNLPCSLLQKKYSVVASSEADTFLYLPRICRLKLKKKKLLIGDIDPVMIKKHGALVWTHHLQKHLQN